jgi:hypothetical protein
LTRARRHVSELVAALGNVDSAFTWLDHACTSRQADIVSIKVDPMLDPIRRDPKFLPM